MRLRFLGKATSGGQSPTLYATDRDSYVVQGWVVDEAAVEGVPVTEGDTVVEVPARLLGFLTQEGLSGTVTRVGPPIVDVTAGGNYVVRGRLVDDVEALAVMDIPEHETCVEVPRADLHALLADV